MVEDNIVTTAPKNLSNWWSSNGRFIVLGVLALLLLILFIYMYKTLRSYSRQLQNITSVLTEQQERLNTHAKLLGNPNKMSQADTNTLSLNDLRLPSNANEIDNIFHLSDNDNAVVEQPIPIVQSSDKLDLDIDEELQEEIQELENSVVKTTEDVSEKTNLSDHTSSPDVD